MACKTLIMHAVISASIILRAKAATFLLSSTCTYHSYLNCTRIFIINHGCAAICWCLYLDIAILVKMLHSWVANRNLHASLLPQCQVFPVSLSIHVWQAVLLFAPMLELSSICCLLR